MAHSRPLPSSFPPAHPAPIYFRKGHSPRLLKHHLTPTAFAFSSSPEDPPTSDVFQPTFPLPPPPYDTFYTFFFTPLICRRIRNLTRLLFGLLPLLFLGCPLFPDLQQSSSNHIKTFPVDHISTSPFSATPRFSIRAYATCQRFPLLHFSLSSPYTPAKSARI